MGLLSSKDKGTSTQKDTPEKVKVKKTVTREKEYTVHTAEIHYANGEKEEVDFDSMIRKDECVVLKNYTGYTPNRYGNFNSEAFMTLPYVNFNKIETVNRRKDSFKYEKEKTTYKKPENVEEDEEIV